MFSNAGEKIKVLASIFFWLESVASVVIACLIYITDESELYLALGIAVGGVPVAWLLNLFLYAVGEFFQNVSALADRTESPADDVEEEIVFESPRAKTVKKVHAKKSDTFDTVRYFDGNRERYEDRF